MDAIPEGALVRRYNWADVPTLRQMYYSDSPHQFVIGPFGCLRGDTLVLTEAGPLPISQLSRPTLVLSHNELEEGPQLSLSGGAFPKGMDYLYRVSTQQGEFVAAGHHHVFCGDHTYRPVSTLKVGDVLCGYSATHLQKIPLVDPLLSVANVRRCLKTIVGSLDYYGGLARQYDQQFLQGEGNGQSCSPAQDGAQILGPSYDWFVSEQPNGLWEQSRAHTHQGQPSFPTRTDGSSYLAVLHSAVCQAEDVRQLFSHISETIRLSEPLLWSFLSHHIEQLSSLSWGSSYITSSTEWSILQIKQLPVKEVFWDMQVMGTNNYVTADGTIHHNSGKSSAMIAKIVKYAVEQSPGQDGIRRSRWAIVRNSFPQLRDTTIRTVKYWLPEIHNNVWRETSHDYTINMFEGVQFELHFRALDRPDHVANLLSLELTGAWLNEFREITKDIYEAMDGRVGRYPSRQEGGCTWSGILADSNPPNKRSYWYRLLEINRLRDPELSSKIKLWKQPSGVSARAENINNLPKNYYQKLAIGKDTLFVDMYIHGLYGYTREGKPVFEMYNDNFNVSSSRLSPVQGLPILMGWDFALNPTCLLGQIYQGQLRILDEVEGEGMGITRMIDSILMPLLYSKYRDFTFAGMGDPSGNTRAQTDESTCYTVLRDKGFTDVVPAPTNALTPRLGAVNHFLSRVVGSGEPSLLISSHCSKLREAMAGGYCFKTVAGKSDEWQDEPAKNQFSHICDALEALCLYATDERQLKRRDETFRNRFKESLIHRSIADGVVGY